MLKNTFKALSYRAFLLLSPVLISTNAYAAEIPLLNHNFDSDAITDTSNANYFISGWVDSGEGSIGVYAPVGNGTYYDKIVNNQGQVAFLKNGGRFSQTVNATLIKDETYTVTFHSGYPKTQGYPNYVVRVKAKGLVIAQKQGDAASLSLGQWNRVDLTFTATENMPIGEPIVLEFANLSSSDSEVNIDNITLTAAGTGTISPGTNLGPLTMIVEDTTLLIPDQYPNILVALRYLDDKQIKVGKTVTIKVNDCSNQVYTQPIEVAHPNGDAIHIIGNVDSPESCTLQFNGVSGFVADNGHKIGLIDGFSLNGTSNTDPDGTESKGIFANQMGFINVGENTRVSNFWNGVSAENNSTIIAQNTISQNNTNHGYSCSNSSTINANGAQAYSNKYGFVAVNSCSLRAYGSVANNHDEDGYYSAHASIINAASATASNNANNGFVAWSFSSIYANKAQANNNTNRGFGAQDMGYIYSYESIATNNGINYSPEQKRTGNNNSYMQSY